MIAFLVTTAALTLIIGLRYLAISGTAHWLLWKRPSSAYALNRSPPSREAMRREIWLSLASSVIYAAPAAWVIEVWKAGGTKLYTDVSAHAWWWIPLSAVLYLLLHDAYYYWLHRLMHDRRLFKWMHAGHHRSREPTAYAAFAFDLTEAALTAWFLPALVFFIPIHVGVALGLLTLMTVVATLNHCGREVWPDRFVRGPVGGWLITATHHSRHHTHLQRNFGLYFRFWDRVMGTDEMPEPRKAA